MASSQASKRNAPYRTSRLILAENKDKIERLEKRRERLCRQNEEANLRALGIDPQQAERLAEIKSENWVN
jgi:hypothetical protein